jgi:hypothetical protein
LNVTNKHKALILTFLISGTILLSLFNFHIKQQNNLTAESYYEIEHQELLTEQELQEIEAIMGQKAETNKAFNETENQSRFSKAYELIEPPQDYVKPDLSDSHNTSHLAINSEIKRDLKPIHKKDLANFDKINNVLDKQQDDASNASSTMSFSLANRTSIYLPTPIYLCERGGKIVINITVNSEGDVIDSYLNTSSTSQNQCLIDHALEYANEARFSYDASKSSQIGSITFYFLGKP